MREQLGADDATGELETRREELGRRLAAKQAEKDRYVYLYAQGHISEAELETHLLDLKNRAENLRLLLGSVTAEPSQKRARQELTQTAHAWLVAFRARRQLVKLLVRSIAVGNKHEDGRIEVWITYCFGSPSPPPAEAAGGEVSVAGLKNGRRS